MNAINNIVDDILEDKEDTKLLRSISESLEGDKEYSRIHEGDVDDDHAYGPAVSEAIKKRTIAISEKLQVDMERLEDEISKLFLTSPGMI